MEKVVNTRMSRRMRNFDIHQAERKKQLYENECGVSQTEMKVKSKYNELEIKTNMMLKDSSASDILNNFATVTGVGGIASMGASAFNLGQVGLGAFSLFANQGYENTEELNKVLETIAEGSIKNSNQANFLATVAVACLGACAISATLSCITEVCREKYNQLQTEKQKPLIEDMIMLDEILTMTKDLRKNDNDMSLNFIKDFLSSVNIQDNTYSFNYELLSRLAQYRVAVLKEMNGEQNKKETEQRFKSIIGYIYENPTLKGASNDFVTNPYINDLIRTYTFTQEEFDLETEEKQEVQQRRRRRR